MVRLGAMQNVMYGARRYNIYSAIWYSKYGPILDGKYCVIRYEEKFVRSDTVR